MNCSTVRLLFKRPIVAVFTVYVFTLILLDVSGYFSCEKRSSLYKLKLVDNSSVVSAEGRVISAPQAVKNVKRFILKTSAVNGNAVNEKIIVNSPIAYSVSYGDIINIEGELKSPFSVSFPLVFDYQKYLARNEIYAILNISSFEYVKSSPNAVKKFALAFRNDILEKIDACFKLPYSSILKSLVIGDKSALSQDIKDCFSNSGIMHILVVSGLHVGFISAVILLFLKLLGFSLRKALLLSIPFMFLYVIATGADPPALRSAIMFSCMIFSLCLGREPLIYNSLALSALIILIFEPQQLFTASFQMSYGATLGIVYFHRDILALFKNVKNEILRFFCGILSVTASAQLALIPLCMYYFGKISLISFLANVIVVPLTGIILYLGIIFYILTFVSQYAALLCSLIVSLLLKIVLSITLFLGNFRFASMLVAKPTIAHLLLFFLFLFSIFGNKKKFIFPGIVLILSFIYFVFYAVYNKNKIFFDVYQNNNIITLKMKNNSANAFIIYNKNKYYDKYYINSFKQFMSFSGIKNADVKVVGFNKEKILSDLLNFDIDIVEDTETKVFDFYFSGNLMSIDVCVRKLYIDKAEIDFEKRISFYYDTKRKMFK